MKSSRGQLQCLHIVGNLGRQIHFRDKFVTGGIISALTGHEQK